jgi:peptide/nickel transport system ATP-binding protein
MSGAASLLELRDVHVRFPVQSGILQRTVGHVHAVDGVNLTVRDGETIGREPCRRDVDPAGCR